MIYLVYYSNICAIKQQRKKCTVKANWFCCIFFIRCETKYAIQNVYEWNFKILRNFLRSRHVNSNILITVHIFSYANTIPKSDYLHAQLYFCFNWLWNEVDCKMFMHFGKGSGCKVGHQRFRGNKGASEFDSVSDTALSTFEKYLSKINIAKQTMAN